MPATARARATGADLSQRAMEGLCLGRGEAGIETALKQKKNNAISNRNYHFVGIYVKTNTNSVII